MKMSKKKIFAIICLIILIAGITYLVIYVNRKEKNPKAYINNNYGIEVVTDL